MSDLVERLREALDAVQNFRGDLDSDDFEDACVGLRFHAAQAAPVLLAELDRLRAQVAASAPAPAPAEPVAQCMSLAPDDRRPDFKCPDQMCGFMGQCRHKPVRGARYAAPSAPAGWQQAGFDEALGRYVTAARALDSEGMRAGYIALRAMLSGWPPSGPIRCWCCASPNWPAGSSGVEHATKGWRWVPVEPTEAMLKAAHAYRGPGFQGPYRAMLAAAPGAQGDAS